MPVPVREQVLAAIQTRLETLAPGAVSRGESASSTTPAIMLWDTRETAEHRNSSVAVTLQLGIEYVAPFVSDSTANEMLAALIQTLSSTDPFFGGLADSCRYIGTEIEYPESGSGLVGVRATFEIKFAFKSGDPYTKP